VVLWILLDAMAVRGLAVAAQRLAYRRAVAQRETDQKNADTATAASEAVEVDLLLPYVIVNLKNPLLNL